MLFTIIQQKRRRNGEFMAKLVIMPRQGQSVESCVITEWQKKKGDKIDVLGNEAVDSEYPEVHYPGEELYYFTEDDIITDEDGNEIDEKSLIGDKLRRFGWMQNEQEAVWVRNNPRETDYHVNKVKDSRDSWFGFDQ